MRFNHVKIPRFNMFARVCEVSREGAFRKISDPRLIFACMLYVRSSIVSSAAKEFLARALTIALRYNAVRRQFSAKPGQLEVKLLNYQS